MGVKLRKVQNYVVHIYMISFSFLRAGTLFFSWERQGPPTRKSNQKKRDFESEKLKT